MGRWLACGRHEVLGIDNLNEYYDVRLKLDRLRELGVVTTAAGSECAGPVHANDSTTGLRFFTEYGPWGRPDMALFVFTNAILRGDTFDLFNHGEMQRDFTYVDDILDGVVGVLDRPPGGVARWDGRQSSVSHAPARVYNPGRGCPTALQDLVAVLEDELGVEAKTRSVPIQPGDMASTWADCTALREEMDFKADTPIRTGVKHFLAW